MASAVRLELYWIPLGAGAQVVRRSGRCYEAMVARRERRAPVPLFHSALIACSGGVRTVIEMTPVVDRFGPERRGVVAEGAVGSPWLGRWRLFRYEIRRWVGGEIPDLAHAVGGPVPISEDPAVVAHVLQSVAAVPTPVWGRDELGTGEMWNSNSVISWVVVRAGVLSAAGSPPGGGRAPGWSAGIVVAGRRAGRE
ncbi:MAG: hypothetical protein IT196_01180 [Acidimicrobiales bacterium]|nr:hypothetical protein [Acidimicrobiales bacterium]